MAASSFYQEIVDNGQVATGTRLVHIAWYDETRNEVLSGAISGLSSPLLQRALAVVQKVLPDFDPTSVRVSADANPVMRRVYRGGEAVLSGFQEMAEGVVPPYVVDVARTLVGLRYSFTYPIRTDGRVIGAISFHGPKQLTAAQRAVCEAFARQAQLTVENVHLAHALNDRMAALRTSEERFRLLAENASDIIYRIRLRPEVRVDYISPAVEHVTGHTPDELYADPRLALRLLHLPQDGRGNLLAAPSRAPTTLRVQRKGGGVAWVEVRLVPINGPDDELVAIEGIARDVTERRQMEEQLMRANRLEAAGRIAGQVAHDFNNLLAPLVGYPELIKMRLPPDHPAVPLCDALLRAAEQLATINQDLLAFGRRGHFTREPSDLNQLVRQAWSQTPPAPPTLEVVFDLAEDLLAVSGSAAQLVRVIVNLITNAREAMGDDGKLAVRTENVYLDRPVAGYSRVEIGEYARLEIADTGPGIDPEIRDKIFDAFFTTKPGARRGAGLGLSVVQSVVEDHRGFVDVQTELGRGTSFILYLPISREVVAPPTHGETPHGHERILIVDDDEMQREVGKELLATLGYQVEVVASGEEAIAWLRRRQADLLVLDMIMPGGIDGAETYRRALQLRADQRGIVVSGYAESDRVKVALALGAGAYLRKPVTMERLARAVRDELDRTVAVGG
jgi:PAS domain S-box-containing protein